MGNSSSPKRGIIGKNGIPLRSYMLLLFKSDRSNVLPPKQLCNTCTISKIAIPRKRELSSALLA